MQISISMSTIYSYGLNQLMSEEITRLKGFIRHIPAKQVTNQMWDASEYSYGVAEFNNALHHNTVEHFALNDLNNVSQDRLWNAFVSFVRNIRKESPVYTLQQFQRDYLISTGPRCNENPLYRFTKPNSPIVFSYLRKFTDFPPNYVGLEKFWEQFGSK